MGIDVELWARSDEPLTDEEVDALTSDFRATFNPRWSSEGLDRYPDLVRPYRPSPAEQKAWGLDEDCEHIVLINTLDRYYGPGYARGQWPRIREMGEWLQERFEGRGEVRYGGDTTDGWEYLVNWPTLRDECDQYWEQEGHLTYRDCDCEHCIAILEQRLTDRTPPGPRQDR